MSGVLDHVKLDLVDSIDKAWEFKRWLGERRAGDALGVDTETAGLTPWRDRLRLVQFGDMNTGWAIPWGGWGGVALEALMDYEGDLVLHNSRFDVNFLRSHSPWRPDWSRIHDTLTLAHLDDPTRSRALKNLGGQLIDSRAAASQSVLKIAYDRNDWDWANIPIERHGEASPYWIYGALDPVLTCHLYEYFKNTRLTYAAPYSLEMGTIASIADMELRGARVDLDYCRSMLTTIRDYSWSVRQWIKEAHGIKNATSTPQCIARFKELGRTITKSTASGADSLDKEQLQMFLMEPDAPGNDLAQAILNLRRGEKFVGPYFSNFEKLADSNSRVHPTIWPVGTRTARMSITEPALQTLPRKDPTVRDAFIPSDGNSLIMCDYDQVEMRLAAHFGGDTGLRDAFVLSDKDFFTTVAGEAYHEEISKEDPRRQLMKNALYATLYGAGHPKIALTAGVPVQTIDIVMAHFHNRFPGIRTLQANVEAVAKRRSEEEGRPYVFTPTGRKMPGDVGKEYTLVNYLIQSHAAEVLKRAICEIEAAGIGQYMVLPVHDELVFDVPNEDVEDVKIVIKQCMENHTDYLVPLTADSDVQPERWGGKYRK